MTNKSSIHWRLSVSRKAAGFSKYKDYKWFNADYVLSNLHIIIHRLQELRSYGLEVSQHDWNMLMDSIDSNVQTLRDMGAVQSGRYNMYSDNSIELVRSKHSLPPLIHS